MPGRSPGWQNHGKNADRILLLHRAHPPHRAGAPRPDRRRLMRDLPLAAVPDGFPGAARTGAKREPGGVPPPSAARRGQRKGVFGDFCRFPQLVRAHRTAAGCLADEKRPDRQGRAAVLLPLRRRALRFRPRACPPVSQSGGPRAVRGPGGRRRGTTAASSRHGWTKTACQRCPPFMRVEPYKTQ